MIIKNIFKDNEYIDTRELKVSDGPGGQVMTSWTCPLCGENQLSGSTNHQGVCDGCQKIVRMLRMKGLESDSDIVEMIYYFACKIFSKELQIERFMDWAVEVRNYDRGRDTLDPSLYH